jgi:hypothetical protein
MPVEIKQLLVKGTMEGTQEPDKKKSSAVRSKAPEEGVSSLSYGLKKQIIDQCVQEVMDRIKKMNEF